jgi:CRP-like cAMP-binding protein
MAIMYDEVERSNANGWEPYFRYGERMFLKRNAIIYDQGKTGSGFYYLHKGLIKIVTSTVKGGERILDIEGPGQVFGEQAMDKRPYFSTAIAAKDSVVYYFSCERFNELIAAYPMLLNLFMDSAIQKIRILAEEIMLKAITSEQQIAFTLLKMSHACKNYEVYLTQQELANYTGLTRITVYKVLKKWKEDELIDVVNRMFIIKQPDILKQHALNLVN